MEISFKNINKAILEVLVVNNYKSEDLFLLELIGDWYYKFLKSNNSELSLVLPFYKEEFAKLSSLYLRFFSLIYKLLNKENEDIDVFTEACLFDVSKYLKKRKSAIISDYLLNYTGNKNGLLVWKDEIYTKPDIFLPVFLKKQIQCNDDLVSIFESFPLFKSLRVNELIKHPVLINFEDDGCLFFNCFGDSIKRIVGEKVIFSTEELDDAQASDLRDELTENQTLTKRIKIKYPYSKSIHHYLDDVGKQRFCLNFRERFSYDEIGENDVFLLPKEICPESGNNLIELGKFEIIDTNHSKSLYDLISIIKNQWNDMELNKYQYPFPKYWFLFINKGVDKDTWINQFRISYPAIEQKPLFNEIKKIISELYDLDWVSQFLREKSKIAFVFPEMRGSKGRRLNTVFNWFVNYVNSIQSNTKFLNSPSECNSDFNIYLLNSFDIINLVNVVQNNIDKRIQIITPDFLYFSYNPWIKYHIVDYQSNVLVNNIRESLDDKFNINRKFIYEIKSDLVKEINKEKKTYFIKYNSIAKEPLDNQIMDIPNIEKQDFEYSNVEEIDLYKSYKSKKINSDNFKIITTKLDEFEIKSNARAFVQRHTLIKIDATSLQSGDIFFLKQDINKMSSDDFINKISKIPETVRNFQSELAKQGDAIYQKLENKGLQYKDGPSYFRKHYLIPLNEFSDEKFKIPRGKENWRIICEYLYISPNDMRSAYLVHFGMKNQNQIKNLYKEIITLLFNNDWFGMIENPMVTERISEIVIQNREIFGLDEKDFNSLEIAQTLIANIENHLIFHEVGTIIQI